MLGEATGWLASGTFPLPAVALIAALLAAIFLLDDVKGLPVPVRFAAQMLAALALLWLAVPVHPLLFPLVAIGIVWCCNLYNFMDGSNGLAGGMAVIGFGALMIGAISSGDSEVALAAGIVAAAAAGFLVWNFDPARIFLGDAGSIPLGFLAAAIGLVGVVRGTWPFWLPLLVFSPFVVDSGLTLIWRALDGEKLSQAHKRHYYQRLIRSGWSHRRLALTAYAVMLAAAVTGLFARDRSALVVVNMLLLWAGIYAVLALAIDHRWSAHERSGQADGRPPR
jgi:UDP-N-acetylmuramyl pentapeptide phosphotransferase/UDP-N-acetylglucosamine-1-phosphate transferase